MKKLLIFVVLAVLAVGFFAFKSNPQSKGAGSVFILAVLEPNVLVKQESQSEFVEVQKSLQVKAGDEIQTSSTGRASLLYPNGDITNIDHDSHLKIKTLEESGNKSVLTLFVGSVLAKVRNAVGTSDYYQIETQNSVASVRGTIFVVKFKEKKSSVFVLENKVLVSAMNPKTGEILEDHGVVDVGSGEKTEVKSDHLPSADYPLEVKLLTKEDISEEFIKKNLDQEDLRKEKIREIFEKVEEPLPSVRPTLRFKDFVLEKPEQTEEIRTTQIPEPTKESVEPPASPTAKPNPITLSTSTPTPTPRPTLIPTPTPNPSSTSNTITPTPTPTPTPMTSQSGTPTPEPIQTSFLSITPKTADVSQEKQEIVINGRKLTGTKQVLIGDLEVKFFVLDESTIFATIPAGFKEGVYDVEITTSKGESLRLENVLTIR